MATEIRTVKLPELMHWYIRPVDQGQIVEVQYGYSCNGMAWKRVTDRSLPQGNPERVAWYCGDLDWDREPEGVDQNRVPCVEEWEQVKVN
jgi:hypothetical protein